MVHDHNAFHHPVTAAAYGSVATASFTFNGTLQVLASIVAIVWGLLMIWESKTVQDWVAKYRARK